MADISNIPSLSLQIQRLEADVLNQQYQAAARRVQITEKMADIDKIKVEVDSHLAAASIAQQKLDILRAQVVQAQGVVDAPATENTPPISHEESAAS